MAAVERRGRPEPADLWLLNPTDPRLVYGHWILQGEGLEQLRELHRRGASAGPARGSASGSSTWYLNLVSVVALLGILTAVVYVVAWFSEDVLPGWPAAPLVAAATSAAFIALAWWLESPQLLPDEAEPIRQTAALTEAIDRLRVRAPSPTAMELASRIRTSWNDALLRRNLDHDPDQWAELAYRVDELLYALALSQPSGRRPMRPDLLRWAERNAPRVLADLAGAVDPAKPSSQADVETVTPIPIRTDDPAIVHYSRYDPNPH